MRKWKMWVMGRFVEVCGEFEDDPTVGYDEYLVVGGVFDLADNRWWSAEELDWLLAEVEPLRSIERSCLEIEEQLFWLSMPTMTYCGERDDLLR